jgi:hypothetical protein
MVSATTSCRQHQGVHELGDDDIAELGVRQDSRFSAA